MFDYVTIRAVWTWEARLPCANLQALAGLGRVEVREASTEGFEVEVRVRCKPDAINPVMIHLAEMGGHLIEGDDD